MTQKTRYFFVGAAAVLVAGIGIGLVAYYGIPRQAAVPPGLPDELRYVPQNAEVVAYADLHTIMNSELRREMERMAGGPGRNRQDVHDVAGIDIEKQVDHVVGYLEKIDENAAGAAPAPDAPMIERHTQDFRGLMLARGTFDQATIESYIRDHGGQIEEYHGRHIAIHHDDSRNAAPGPDGDMAVGFLQPNLVAMGHADLVRRAVDRTASTSSSENVTRNGELMTIIRAASGDTAWVVGHFDAVTRRMGVPPQVRQQVPPLRLVSAKAHIDGGLKATIRADTEDQKSADQMRDVVRGFISLIRMQAGAKPELQEALKSIELAGTGSTVQLSFAMSPETFRAIMPARGQRPGGLMPPAPPAPPVPPAPPRQ